MPFIPSIERPDDEGRKLNSNALLTHNGPDTEEFLTRDSLAINRASVKCRGQDVYCVVGTVSSGNTVVMQLAFYDENNKLCDVSPKATLTSGLPRAALTASGGTENNRYLTEPFIWPANDSYKVIPYIVSMTTSEHIDVFVWGQSEEVNA